MKHKCDGCGALTDNEEVIKRPSGTPWLIVRKCDKCKKKWENEFDWGYDSRKLMEDTIICPYCNAEYDDYDCWEFDDGETEEVECEFCGKKFDLEIETSRTYTTRRSLCEMPEGWTAESEEDE